MRVLVTGHTGFVGQHVLPLLRPIGLVWGASRRATDDNSVSIDIRDTESRRALLRDLRPNIVIHLAGAAQTTLSGDDIHAINVDATLGLVHDIRGVNPHTRIVVASTGYVYGETNGLADEGHALAPIGDYAQSKATMERAIEGEVDNIVMVRAFNHTGPGQTLAYAVPAFAQRIVAAERQRVVVPPPHAFETGDLTAVRDFADVRDLARVFAWCAVSPKVPRVLNVCSGKPLSLAMIWQRLLELSDLDPSETTVRSHGHAVLRHNGGNPTLCHNVTGIRSRPLDDTLRDVLHDWRNRSA